MRLLTLNPPPPIISSLVREAKPGFQLVPGARQQSLPTCCRWNPKKTENGSAVQSSGNKRACERFGASQGGLLTVRGGGGGSGGGR